MKVKSASNKITMKKKNNDSSFIKEIQQHGGGIEQEDDDALGKKDVLEIEEHKPEDIKKAHEQYMLNQANLDKDVSGDDDEKNNNNNSNNETKILQNREAAMEAV